MDWTVLIIILALMLAPLALAITAVVAVVLSQRARSYWIVLGLLLPQALIIALILWPGGLKVVSCSSEILMWLVTLITWLTLFLARWQRRGTPPVAALVTGWLLFFILAVAYYFDSANQSTMAWKRNEQQMEQNLRLLEQGAYSQLDRLSDERARELFYRAAAKEYPEQVLHYFIRRGLSPLDEGENGYSALSNAIESHNAAALKLFLSVLTPAQIQSLSFDYDPLRNLRLDPPGSEADQQQFYASMALLLAARPDWIHPRDTHKPSYLTTAIFNGNVQSANFLLPYLPAPQGLWRLALLALNDDTQSLMAALRQGPLQLEQILSDGEGRRLSLMAWMIKYAPPQTRTALLNSKLIVWDHYQEPSERDGEGVMTNTLIDESRGNWRFRDESPSVLQQVLTSAIAQGVTLSPEQMLAVFRYEDEPKTLAVMRKAGLPCGPLMSASAQLLTDSVQDTKVRRWISESCLRQPGGQ